LDGCEYTSKDGTKGRVCDSNCSRGDAYGTLGCGAKSGKYGAECRACYNDVEKARKQDMPGNRAIMCSTKMPVDVYDRRLTADDESDPLLVARDLEALQEDASSPSEEEEHRQLTEDVPKWKAEEKWRNNTVPKCWRANQKWKKQYEDSPDEEGCLDGCEYTSKDGTKGRVCDSNCSKGDAYGTLGCGAKSGKYGADCRACYNDVEKARKQDTPGNRAIMCSTKMPVDVYGRRLTADDESDPLLVARDLEVLQEDASSPSEEEEHRQLTEDVPKWKAEEKWRNNTVPKCWRANQKWKKQYEDSPDEEGCLDGCEYTSKDGTKGRVCDSNCSRGDAYGTLGCGAKSGKYGAECRACYNDVEKARKQDTPGNRAIMCSTKMPVDVYGRRLTPVDESDPLLVARDLEVLQEDASSPSEEEHRQLTEDVPKWKAEEKWRNNTVPKWKQNQKWKTKKDDGVPKWRANQKWKKQYEDSPDEEGCLDGCEYTSKDGTKGRVCDSNCSRGDAYGTLGCGAKSGKYGAECRACYNDVEKARKQDTPGNRAIMCSTKMPVDVYDRRLTADDESDPLLVARDLEVLQEDASSPSEEEHRQLTDDVPKWKAEEKWRNNTVPKCWRANQKWKKQYEDSPDEEGCLDGCEYTSKDGTKGRVCDSNCSRGDAYGTLGCGAKSGKYGAECRACYNDLEKARKQDTPGNRAIMCSTKMPVDVYDRRLTADDESDPLLVAHDLEVLQEDASSPSQEEEHRQLTEDVPKWKTQEKWKNNTVPKCWRANQKWKKQYEDSPDEEGCLDGCEYTSKDGTKGRVCDSNCSRGDAYGTLGCGAKSGKYGAECRACYNDVKKARKQDTPGNRAIMCSTREPVDVYGRRLSAHHEDYSLELAQLMGAEDSEDEDSEDGFEPRVEVEVGGREKAIRFFEAAAERTYLGEVQRSDLCAFVSGRVGDEAMWEVTVKSILQFMPGMKVAIAAEAEGLDAYERSMGRLPGVTVSGTQNPSTAALYADKYCSFSELILYVKPGSVLSRSFTPKDTHSPRGDLLVVHTGSQGSYHDTELSRRSSSVLGFEAPSFTQGTDLMLPGDANYYLREALGLKIGSEGLRGDGDGDAVIALQEFVDFDQVSAVPQVLAAVAYSRKTPGVWFVDPRGWVGQNLFKEASIWDIPLVKPRFTCTIAADKLDSASPKTAQVLQSSVDFFANGGKCANGLIAGAP
ncbi:unnamed protein product, partial [Ectocarpus sp. 12 AP-2014]